MKRFAMMWDFPEVNIFGGSSGDAWRNLEYITAVIRREGTYNNPVHCQRGSATSLSFENESFDAVITDPPYYDNESYAELSDVCYVWLRPTLGFLYPEHFASSLTPKKKECVAAAYRQGGTREAANLFYEDCIAQALREAWRVTKKSGLLVLVYAHKTTAGWSTLVEALKDAGYTVVEAWPIETETKSRVAHQGDAALASSIFIVARKREGQSIGSYEDEVQPVLRQIVNERVKALWKQGISGANLLIACVGAGLRAFTKYAKVEYANGEAVPAERFLAEIETVVLDTILRRLSRAAGSNGHTVSLEGLDPATRFYVLWRYTYRFATLDAGEAIIFANGTHVELDGPNGLSSGTNALLEKKKGKYRLQDFRKRGKSGKIGLPVDGAEPPVIDSLHRILWLMENKPASLAEFLSETNPKKEPLHLVAQVLAGPVLKGGKLDGYSPPEELSVLAKLTANWKSVVEDATYTKTKKKTGIADK
jgi:putative DNA methylase